MTKQMKAAMAAMLLVGTIYAQAQTTTTTTATAHSKKKTAAKKPVPESAVARELRVMREKQAEQQAQIDRLTKQIADKDIALTAAQTTATDADAKATAAQAQAATATATVQTQSDDVKTLKTNVSDLQTTNTGLAQTISATKTELTEKIDSPLAIHYKGITITPGGFAAAESVYRTRAMDSDINTPFSSTPYMNNAQAYTSEFNGTGRQSRLAVLVTAPLSWGKIGSYYEMDFLSAGVTSNNNQTNSYTMRQREAWAQLSTNSGFTVTGGQMWSLVTEVKKGINEAPGIENLPQTIDPQYHVGFSFTRQYGVRFAQTLGKKSNIAFALEEGQTVLATVTNAPTNFFFGADGNTGGLYNSTGNGSVGAGGGAQNYTNNVAPDVIVKFTTDQKFGHFEVGGIARFFRDRVYNQPGGVFTTAVLAATSNPGTNYTTLGGGFFANARVPVTHFLDLGVHVMQGAGTGRYGTSNLGDVTVRPNGLLEPLRNSQGLASIETHPAKKLDIFGYAGGEYLQRTVYSAFNAATGTTVLEGYAPVPGQNDSNCSVELPPTAANGYSPASSTCTGATRAVLEGSAGFTYRIFSSPTKGRFQYSMVYSYLEKSAWTGINTHDASGYGSPKATNNMVFTGIRYYIP